MSNILILLLKYNSHECNMFHSIWWNLYLFNFVLFMLMAQFLNNTALDGVSLKMNGIW